MNFVAQCWRGYWILELTWESFKLSRACITLCSGRCAWNSKTKRKINNNTKQIKPLQSLFFMGCLLYTSMAKSSITSTKSSGAQTSIHMTHKKPKRISMPNNKRFTKNKVLVIVIIQLLIIGTVDPQETFPKTIDRTLSQLGTLRWKDYYFNSKQLLFGIPNWKYSR